GFNQAHRTPRPARPSGDWAGISIHGNARVCWHKTSAESSRMKRQHPEETASIPWRFGQALPERDAGRGSQIKGFVPIQTSKTEGNKNGAWRAAGQSGIMIAEKFLDLLYICPGYSISPQNCRPGGECTLPARKDRLIRKNDDPKSGSTKLN